MKYTVCLLAIWGSIFCGPLMAQQPDEAVEVEVDRLRATPIGISITLRAFDSPDAIRMMIGFSEGQSIARAIRRQDMPRPMTHDLFKSVLDRNGWQVQKVVIRALEEGTFLADLTLEKGDETQIYDARPSDAMAIGLRYGAKIYVKKKVFEQQKQEEERQEIKPDEPESLRL